MKTIKNLIPSIEKNIADKKQRRQNTNKNGLNNYCWKLWHANVITWDGLVVPCCFDKDAMHRLGNLKPNHSNKYGTTIIINNLEVN